MPKTDLQISYNRNMRVGVLNDDVTPFLLLDQFFDDFHILTERKQPWLQQLPLQGKIASLNMPVGRTFTIESLLRSKKFLEYVKANPKIKFDLYKPLDPPYKVNPLTYLMNSPTIAHAYENKRYFRDEFADLIRMPEYEIMYMNALDRAAAYQELREQFGSFVLQDEESHGSRGTYVIHNQDDYVEAIKSLKKYSQGRTIVVSKFVGGEVSSVQVCITKYGIFSGGIQRQLLDSKYLCDPKMANAAKWCGGELGTEYPDIVQHQAREIATVVGSELASHGYKGIFGIDLIVTPENEAYAIEINARHTGYSHLISDMQIQEGKIPFMLLHVLELSNVDYEVKDWDQLPSSGLYEKPVSYLIINNPLDEDIVLKHTIQPGIYKVKKGKLEFVREAYSIDGLKGEDTILITCKYNEGEVIERGKRILKVTKYGNSMAKNDLNGKTQKLVATIKQHFDLPR